MRRDEQLDAMELTISRIRMDNDKMREEIANWRAERDQLKAWGDKLHHWLKHLVPICEQVGGDSAVESELIRQAREYLDSQGIKKL